MRFAVLVWLGVFALGCQCEPVGTALIYACKSDADCVDGYVCGKVSRTCVKTGTIERDGGGGVGGGGVGGGGGGALPPTSLAFVTTLPNPLLAGACVLSTVQARRMAVATAVAADTTVALTETAAGTARYYSDGACSVPVTSTTILAGQTNADFYVKPLTGGTTTQSATAPFGGVARTLTILGAVRRTNCTFAAPVGLPDGGSTEDYVTSCAISPPHQNMAHTALFYQATTSSGSAGTAAVRCRLTSTSSVSCNRVYGSSSGNIHLETVELPVGLRVERLSGSCSGHAFTGTLPAAVNPATSFLLKAYSTPSGDVDDDDLLTAELTSSTTLAFEIGAPVVSCGGGNYEIQAVELSGISVTRGTGDGGMPIATASSVVSGLSATSLNTALLTQHTVADTTNDPICNVLVRSEMPSSSSISFTRAIGATGTCLAVPVFRLNWERIDFGSRGNVQTRTVTLPVGTTMLPVTITTVDPSRTIVFASSQAGSGQSDGEASYAGPTSYLGEGNARFELSSLTNVNVIRQRSAGAAVFTFYVVELDP